MFKKRLTNQAFFMLYLLDLFDTEHKLAPKDFFKKVHLQRDFSSQKQIFNSFFVDKSSILYALPPGPV